MVLLVVMVFVVIAVLGLFAWSQRNATLELAEKVQGQTRAQNVQIAEHRERDRQHMCFLGLDLLELKLIIRDIAKQAHLDFRRITTRLRPEVIEVCAEIGVNGY